MKLTWMGAAALLLEQEGFTLAVDPFPGMPLGRVSGPNRDEDRFRRRTRCW